jgi:hypothetical protein
VVEAAVEQILPEPRRRKASPLLAGLCGLLARRLDRRSAFGRRVLD